MNMNHDMAAPAAGRYGAVALLLRRLVRQPFNRRGGYR